jgi:protein involved in polysaccharide export with SLBB domain
MTLTTSRWIRAARRAGITTIVLAMTAALPGAVTRAQQLPATGATDTAHASPSRAELEAQATQLEREAQRSNDPAVKAAKSREAAAIRTRLRDGDIQVGDRLALVVQGDSTLDDTVTVRAGQMIQLHNLPPISLVGVLRSELPDYLTKQLSQYLKNPQVQATPLVQVAVIGSVVHPGFYWVPPDLTLTDVIMLAGGPTQTADVNKTKILRQNQPRFSDDSVRKALAAGATLADLGTRAGDQLLIGEKGKTDWVRVLQVAGGLAAVTVSVIAISRH